MEKFKYSKKPDSLFNSKTIFLPKQSLPLVFFRPCLFFSFHGSDINCSVLKRALFVQGQFVALNIQKFLRLKNFFCQKNRSEKFFKFFHLNTLTLYLKTAFSNCIFVQIYTQFSTLPKFKYFYFKQLAVNEAFLKIILE